MICEGRKPEYSQFEDALDAARELGLTENYIKIIPHTNEGWCSHVLA
jgi:hypothetical protein